MSFYYQQYNSYTHGRSFLLLSLPDYALTLPIAESVPEVDSEIKVVEKRGITKEDSEHVQDRKKVVENRSGWSCIYIESWAC